MTIPFSDLKMKHRNGLRPASHERLTQMNSKPVKEPKSVPPLKPDDGDSTPQVLKKKTLDSTVDVTNDNSPALAPNSTGQMDLLKFMQGPPSNNDTEESATDEAVGTSVWDHFTRRLYQSVPWTQKMSLQASNVIIPGPLSQSEAAQQVRYPIGFSFSPAGLLLPYHLGVIEYLQSHGLLTDEVPLAGASAGAIAVTIAALQIPIAEIMRAVFRMEAVLRQHGTRGRLKRLVESELRSFLPENCHEIISKRKAPAHVLYTRVNFWKASSVWEFTGKNDVIECVLASCNIPFYFGHGPVLECRGQWCIDGYFSDRKNFGCPKIDTWGRQIRVAPFSKQQILSHLRDLDVISPSLDTYDKDIPHEKFEAFKNYLRQNPAPIPEALEELGLEPAVSQNTAIPEVVPEARRSSRRSTLVASTGTLEVQPAQKSALEKGLHSIKKATVSGLKRSSSVGSWVSYRRGSSASKKKDSTVVREGSNEQVPELERHSSRQTGGALSFFSPLSFMKAFTENLMPPEDRALNRPDAPAQPDPAASLINFTSDAPDSPEPPTASEAPEISDRSAPETRAIESPLPPRPDKSAPPSHLELYTSDVYARLPNDPASAGSSRRGHWRRRSRRSNADCPVYTQEGLLKFTFTWMDLLNYALKPTPTDQTVRDLFDLGRADAFRWAVLNKLQ
eukprot:Blabericola_migrator_1__4233@NODE_229_length_11083_cov_77_301198_g195_i0_p1_GENE_NODE_229_length_11083_cov_77_301198_g195_i0NODE_229_length_11083_cov_77_301198_g195_i0_p1_ORF_typecomplete_len675_score82_77Patatin/PF01734_22/1_4e07_NODE_229_length_11083_cov_77_301198_g195_i022514275